MAVVRVAGIVQKDVVVARRIQADAAAVFRLAGVPRKGIVVAKQIQVDAIGDVEVTDIARNGVVARMIQFDAVIVRVIVVITAAIIRDGAQQSVHSKKYPSFSTVSCTVNGEAFYGYMVNRYLKNMVT